MLSASPVTATHGTRWRSYYAAQMWVDDIAYSDTGITDADTIAPAVPAGLSATRAPRRSRCPGTPTPSPTSPATTSTATGSS